MAHTNDVANNKNADKRFISGILLKLNNEVRSRLNNAESVANDYIKV